MKPLPSSRMNGQQRSLLLVVHRQFARGVEDDRVEIVEVLGVAFELFLRDELRVRADIRVPQTGFFAPAFEGSPARGRRNRADIP